MNPKIQKATTTTHRRRFRRNIISNPIHTSYFIRYPGRYTPQNFRWERKPKNKKYWLEQNRKKGPIEKRYITSQLSWNLRIVRHEVQWPKREREINYKNRKRQLGGGEGPPLSLTCSYVLISPITPTALTGSKTAKACAIWSYNPALRISSMYIWSACCRILTCSRLTGPRMRIARPGPGNGCLPTSCEGIDNNRPNALTSS